MITVKIRHMASGKMDTKIFEFQQTREMLHPNSPFINWMVFNAAAWHEVEIYHFLVKKDLQPINPLDVLKPNEPQNKH